MVDIISDMPCIPQITETTTHQVFTVDIALERQTSYILDIESIPAMEDPLTPLFRTAFTTSRFISVEEFASVIADRPVQEKRLKADLQLNLKTEQFVIPSATQPAENLLLNFIADADLEAALLTAYGTDVPAGRQPGISLLWNKETPAQKIGLLIDAPEQLLRTMIVPVRVDTPTPDDDAIQHFQNGSQLFMEVVETGSTVIDKIIYTTGRCRILVLFKPGSAGILGLALKRHRHILLEADPLSVNVPLLQIKLPELAPWEI